MNTKRLFGILIVIVLMTFCGNVFGQTVNEARIGSTEYATLTAACTAANTSGGTVVIETLVPEITMTSAVTFNKSGLNVTLKTADELGDTTVITRGYDGKNSALFATSITFTVDNIIFDGKEGDTQHIGRAINATGGTLTILNSTFRNFRNDSEGGAIYTSVGGTIANSIFRYCSVPNSSNCNAGGAINTKKAIVIRNDTDEEVGFYNCTSSTSGGGIQAVNAAVTIENTAAGSIVFNNCGGNNDGGAVDINTGKPFTINNTGSGTVSFIDCYSDAGGVVCAEGSNILITNRNSSDPEHSGIIEVTGCHTVNESYNGGGLYANGYINIVNDGTVSFDGCYTYNDKKGGGGIFAGGNVSITGTGNLTFKDCHAGNDSYGGGGGINANGAVTIEQDGGASFVNCQTLTSTGGGIFAGKGITIRKTGSGDITFTNCVAKTAGGGIHATGSSTNHASSVMDVIFIDCRSAGSGAGMYLTGTDKMTHTVSNCQFEGHVSLAENTVNAVNGGGLGIGTSANVSDCIFNDCTASSTGGAIRMDGGSGDSWSLANCVINGHNTLAENIRNAVNGGAIYINADNGSAFNNVSITDCWTTGDGGGLYASDVFTSTDGAVSFNNCYTTGGLGGGAYFYTSTGLGKAGTTGNTVTFTNCHADGSGKSGGGAYFGGVVTIQEGTTVSFGGDQPLDTCSAAANGGGANFTNTVTLNAGASMAFNSCQAGNHGGGGYFASTVTMNAGSLSFEDCYSSSGNGGGAYFNNTVTLNEGAGAAFKNCSAGVNGGGAYFNVATSLTGNVSFIGNTATNGGGIYFYKASSINGATVTGNTAGKGGGIYAVENLTLLGNTVIEGNSLSEGIAVGNGGGIYMPNSKTLIIGATTDGDSGNSVTVSGNTTFDGDASNVRLAANGNNNATTAVSVLSKMTGMVGVCNPGAKGTQLGTQPSAQLVDPGQDPRVFSDFDSRVAVTKPEDPLKVFWEGDYVCKITDAEGHLLTYRSGGSTYDAKFYSLWQAFEQLNSTEENHFNGTPAYLKMLCDYFMRKVATMNATRYNDIILTTAGLDADSEDDLPYLGPTSDDTIATLYKGQLNNTMINMSAANEKLKVESITIDGRANANQTTATWRTGGMFLVNAADAQLTLGEMATLQNINVNSGNSTIHVSNGEAVVSTGALFDNCHARVNGGVARVAGASSTLTMTGGTIQNCGTTQNGGAFYTDASGNLNINAGATHDITINTCTAANGGAIYSNNSLAIGPMEGSLLLTECTASSYGGAIYANNTATLNDCDIFGNTAQRGGGIYANNNLTLKNGTSVTGNKLSTNTVTDGAGIYMVNNRTLILGDASIETEYSTVTGNETADGEDSNVRLAWSSPNNWASAVDVQSNLGDYISVCNPGPVGTKFGTDLVQNSAYRQGLSFLVSDDGTQEGVIGTFIDPSYTEGEVFWKAVGLPTDPICKITDSEGNLLTYGSTNVHAVFTTLKNAVSALQTQVFKDLTGTEKTPTHIKMLVDGFSVVSAKAIEVKNRSFTLTTAGIDDPADEYPYQGGADHWPATIYKGRIPVDQNGILKVCNTTGEVTLTFSDIIMDGRANADIPVPTLETSANGACIASARKGNSSATKSAIVLADGTTIQNCRTSSSGAVFITNGGELQIENGVHITNCINNSAGGAVCVTGTGSTLSMNGGTIDNCISKSNGGAFSVSTGSLNAMSGVFNDCKSVAKGGAIHTSTSQPTILTLCQFEDCASNINNNSSYASTSGTGGAVYSDRQLEIYGCSFTNITSGLSDGGAVNLESSGPLIIDEYVDGDTHIRTTFENCVSKRCGGAVLYEPNSGHASLKHTDFVDCVCLNGAWGGGGFWTDSYDLEVEDCTFTDCKGIGSYGGGGLYQSSSNSSVPVTMKDCVFTSCESSTNGGGAVLSNTAVLENCTFTSNTAKNNGGGLYFKGGTLTMSGLMKADNNTKTTDGSLNNVYMASSNKTISIGDDGLLCGSHIGVSNNSGNNRVVATGTEANCRYASANRMFFDDTDTYRAYCLSKTVGSTTYTPNKIYFIESWRNVADANGVSVAGDIITVNSAAGLAYIAKQVNNGETYEGKTIKLNADLDLNKLGNHVYNWEPIGLSSTCSGDDARPFKGTFDGQGHIISNLNSYLPYKAMGLFGMVKDGTVTNTFIENGTMEGTCADGTETSMAFMGGLVGQLDGGTVTYSEAAVNLTASTSCAMGGLVGMMDGNTIHSCMAMPELTNGTMMGGLVGKVDQGEIQNSFANPKFNIDGDMTTWTVGGLAGSIVETEMGNCYAMVRGTVPTAAANKQFGWLAGYEDEISVHHCYIPDGYSNYFGGGEDSASESGTYNPTALPGGKYGYGQCDQQISEGANDYVSECNGAIDDEGNLKGLVAILNKWVDDNQDDHGYALWTRTMASPINDDYPVLMMPSFDGVNDNISLGSKNNASFIRYSADLDAHIDAYNKADGGGNIYLYGVPDRVGISTDEDVRVYIEGDIGIEQGTGTKMNARVGVMLDNSKKDPSFWGMPYDWHMFSSALKAAPLGLEYHTTESGYEGVNNYALKDILANDLSLYVDASTYANAHGEMDPPKTTFSTTPGYIGYFPTDTPYGQWRGTVPQAPYGATDGFDFYCYSEEYRHWVNFKREGTTDVMDHWHQNADADGKHYKIQYYNDDNSVLKPGKGYLAAVGQPSMLMADGVLNNGDVMVATEWSESDSGSEWMLSGVNLLGNPYQSYLDFERFANDVESESWTSPNTGKVADNTYYVVDADKGGYVAYISGGSSNEEYAPRLVHPHQGFLVRVPSAETIQFTSGMRVAGDYKDGGALESSFFREGYPNYVLVNLLCYDSSGKRDLTTVEAGRPELGGARKVYNLRMGNGMLFAHIGEESYQALFAPDSITEVPVRFRAFNEDVFTMRWSVYNGEFAYLHLVDHKTGADIDCLTTDEYVFEGRPEDYLSRFVLKFRRSGYSIGEYDEATTSSDSFAFINGNELVVNGEGRLELFDLQGRMLRGVSLTGQQCRVPLPVLSTGVYLLRLTGERNVRTQKIIINK